jgi:hypothetical protein
LEFIQLFITHSFFLVGWWWRYWRIWDW